MNDVLIPFEQRVTTSIDELNTLGYKPSVIRICNNTRQKLKSDSFLVCDHELPKTLLGFPVRLMDMTTRPQISDQICGVLIAIDDTVDEMEFVMDADYIGYCSLLHPARFTSLA